MNKRVFSLILTIVMLLGILPIMPVTAEGKPSLYVLGDVYGAPGETVDVKIGFRNMGGKNIQQLEACLSAGSCKVVETTALQLTPAANGCFGYANATSGVFAVSGGTNSFSGETVLTVQVKIPESAGEGDTYPISLSKSTLFPSVLQWADGTSPNGDVTFEGATLYVTRFTPVKVSVLNTEVTVGDTEIRVPVVMSATNARLSACTGLQFSVSGAAASKVQIDRYASIEYAIQGANTKYTVMAPESAGFCLGYSAGYENAVAPSGDNFKIFELVLKVKTPLAIGDSIKIDIEAEDNAFKVYGNSATDTTKLYVTDFIDGTVTVDLPYLWEVVDEADATARLTKYTGSATEVEIPSYVVGNDRAGTKGKIYKVVELYGDSDKTEGVFYENEDVTTIIIPESVKTINEYAISECPALVRLVVKTPDAVIAEEDGSTFLHYYVNKKTGYILPEDLVIEGYESSTVRQWAENNGATFKSLFGFAGVQIGSGQLRFVGATVDLEYQNVWLEIKCGGTTYDDLVTNVFTTLKGTVDGVERPVVTTDAEVHAQYAAAYYIEAYRYLFGYELTAAEDATFTVTPKATTAHGVVVSGKTVTVNYVGGQISYS